jgi:hypothetical protein
MALDIIKNITDSIDIDVLIVWLRGANESGSLLKSWTSMEAVKSKEVLPMDVG